MFWFCMFEWYWINRFSFLVTPTSLGADDFRDPLHDPIQLLGQRTVRSSRNRNDSRRPALRAGYGRESECLSIKVGSCRGLSMLSLDCQLHASLLHGKYLFCSLLNWLLCQIKLDRTLANKWCFFNIIKSMWKCDLHVHLFSSVTQWDRMYLQNWHQVFLS